MQNTRLSQQMAFIVEIDKLKQILRQTLLTDSSRQENSAEHSWHIGIMAMVLAEYAPTGTDIYGAMKMLLIHDLVEIDAGDVFCYDIQANINKTEKEQEAAKRLFGMLPEDLGKELKVLWEEFEARETATAKYAAALDRIQPTLHNQQTEGGTWRIHGIKRGQVMKRIAPVQDCAPELWNFMLQLIDDCVKDGYLADE